MIYFIQAGPEGPIKIGKAKNPWSRIKELQTSNFEELFLRAVLDVPDEVERHFHDMLSGSRISGEWFNQKELYVNLVLACAQAGFILEPYCLSCHEKNIAPAGFSPSPPRTGEELRPMVALRAQT